MLPTEPVIKSNKVPQTTALIVKATMALVVKHIGWEQGYGKGLGSNPAAACLNFHWFMSQVNGEI